MKGVSLEFTGPVGKFPKQDKDLRIRINKLPKGASMKDFIDEIDDWENLAIIKYKEIEQKAKSHVLDI
ncbi:MAG TPA: hypothetical protein ENH28_03130 [Euryarchaeota archaeon]|nr:hypothetical protein BMS3Bbin15_00387 [archaeon BMS3Bbin15]HDL15135.1 hypothetical protein [Euryarchaeota archaeon]